MTAKRPRSSFALTGRPAALPTAVALAALCLVQQTAAQTAAPAASAEPNQLDTVVVTGLRASLENALNKKRTSSGVVDVIRAEDLGKFPDTNLAESLQRVPGVAIDRDAGEGRQITVRGLGGGFTRTRINGLEAMASTGGSDASGGNNRGRTMDFNVFASELFNSITVRKTGQAEVDEGSLGATIDLTTGRPFDLKKGFTALASVKGTYNDLSGKSAPRATFLIADTFMDKKFGALFSAAYSKRNLFEEGFGTVRWDNGTSNGGWCPPQGATIATGTTLPSGSTATTCGPAAQGISRLPNTPENQAAYQTASSANNFHPRLPRYMRLVHEQERLGITSSFQAKPMDGTLVTLDYLYAKLDATRQENYLEAMPFSRALSSGGKPQVSVLAAEYDANGGLLYGKYNAVDMRSEQRFDKLYTIYKQPTLTVEHELSDTAKLTVLAGRSDSQFRNPIQTTTTLDAPNTNGYEIDFRTGSRTPLIKYGFDPAQVGGALTIVGVPAGATSIANGLPSEIRIRPNGTDNRTDTLTGSIAWEFADDMTLKAGASYKKYSFNTFESRRGTEVIFGAPAGTSVASLSTTITGIGKGQSLPAGTITGWAVPNLDAIASAYDIYCNCLKSGPANGPGDFTLTSITNGNARGSNFGIEEVDRGWYAQLDFKARLGDIPVRGDIGTRFVKTQVLSTGYLATGGGTKVSVPNTYSDMLPSANLTAELTRNWLLRAGVAQVMTRPNLGSMNPGGSISTTGQLNISNGNPLLQPFRAKTLDLGTEWYFAKNSMVGAGFFYKDISSFITSTTINLPFNQTGLPQSLLPSNFTGNEIFSVRSSFNTEGGKVKGLELNYQQPFTFLPSFGKNIGLLANYTFIKSKIKYATSATNNTPIQADLINMSPRSWNASLYYDDGTLMLRASVATRSKYLQAVPGATPSNDVDGKNGTRNVDFSASYKISKKFSVSLEAINLTNQANDLYTSSVRNSVVQNTVTGREVMVGARMDF